jgi:IS5 family transposase
MFDWCQPVQASFSDLEYVAKKRKTRRDRFLAEIEAVTPWAALLSAIEPVYPKGEAQGRPPIGLEKMLRMYIAQQCFGLSDEVIDDALYDSHAIRRFVGMDLGRESAPDATTLLKFRRLLEENKLTATIFETINRHLAAKGLMMRGGTVVNTTIIAAPSSTKNNEGKRDPEMYQTKKGNQRHFGMKAHIGVDADSGLTHTLITTPANTADVNIAHQLLHGKETVAFGDAGYLGVDKRAEQKSVKARWHMAMRPGKRRTLPDNPMEQVLEELEQLKASVRAKVKHPVHIIKNLFGLRKVRYRGLAKNAAWLYTLFGLANLVIAARRLGIAHTRIAS